MEILSRKYSSSGVCCDLFMKQLNMKRTVDLVVVLSVHDVYGYLLYEVQY